MLLMTSASDLVRVITDTGTVDIECFASWVDNVSGTITPGRTNTASITSAVTTTIVAAPGSGQRSVRHINIHNNHASTACGVIVFHTDGTNQVDLTPNIILAASETLVYGENGIWVLYDPAMKPYMGLGPVATQAEMEAGTSLTTMVTPGRLHNHPAACKFWVDTSPGSVNNASYNVTSVLDTTAGITVITIATDFSSVNWCCQAAIESTSDTMTVTNLKFCRVGLADQAAGTVSIESHDLTAITAVIEDPTSWYVAGYGDQ